MRNVDTFEHSPKKEPLSGMLARHNKEYLTNGVYQAWIAEKDRAYGGNNDILQKELSAFARIELPLAALRKRYDMRYPEAYVYFVIKFNPTTGERIKYGVPGEEPTFIIAFTDEAGNIVKGHDKPPYSAEQVGLVIQNAEELEAAGYSFQGAMLSDLLR